MKKENVKAFDALCTKANKAGADCANAMREEKKAKAAYREAQATSKATYKAWYAAIDARDALREPSDY